MAGDVKLKPGWLAEEMNKAAMHAADVEVAISEMQLQSAKDRALSIVELAQGRLNRAYKERDRCREALARQFPVQDKEGSK